MQAIKKYANRKLYHTNRKKYITLEGIAQLVQAGEQVQVVDNETGEDITAGILAQVVLQTRGQSGGPLPATVLTGLIQLGGDRLAGLRRALFASLGGQDIVDAEIERRLDHLVNEGALSIEEDTRLRSLLLRHDLAQASNNDFAAREAEVPSRNDVVRLHAQVDKLMEAVEHLAQQRALSDEDHHPLR